jgi:hypothetical protein
MRMFLRAVFRARCAAAALVGAAVLSGGQAASAACVEPPGDVSGNGSTNIVDVQCLILAVLQTPTVPSCIGVPIALADTNCDQAFTVGDIVLAITYTLGGVLGPQIDADGSNCPDSCEGPAAATARALWATTPSQSASFRLVPRGGLAPITESQSSSFRLAPVPNNP